jgi:hypothetical protein
MTIRRHQRGGVLKFTREFKTELLNSKKDADITPIDVINLLISKVSNVRLIWDGSVYSFVFEFETSECVLKNTFGLEKLEYVPDVPDNDEHGESVQRFCVKLSVMCHGAVRMKQEYKDMIKLTTFPNDAMNEATIQERLHNAFSCHSTTSVFVAGVVEHAFLSVSDFETSFALLKNYDSTKSIYEWIIAWIEQNPAWMGIDVLFMEMFDKPRFQTVHSLGVGSPPYNNAMIRVAAQFACVTGLEIILLDGHGNNALSDKSGTMCRLIDLGNVCDLNDDKRIEKQFNELCIHAELRNTSMLRNLSHFFRCTPEAIPIFDQFTQSLESLKTCNFMLVPPTVENTHNALMMLTLIDFIINFMDHSLTRCQCGETMKCVYGDPLGIFSNFTRFLQYGSFDYSTFVKNIKTNTKKDYVTRLPDVVSAIEKIVKPCQSKSKLPVNALSPDWEYERMFRREETARRAAEEEAARRAAEEESARRAAAEEKEINSLIAMYTKMSLKGGKTRVKKGRTRKHIKCNTRRKRRNKHKTMVRKHFK